MKGQRWTLLGGMKGTEKDSAVGAGLESSRNTWEHINFEVGVSSYTFFPRLDPWLKRILAQSKKKSLISEQVLSYYDK